MHAHARLAGLTVLAYRYDGMRRTDVQRLADQMKHDLSRQVGPRSRRPASLIFNSWITAQEGSASNDVMEEDGEATEQAVAAAPAEAVEGVGPETGPTVLPLTLFQPNDVVQLSRLHRVIRRRAAPVHYYLRKHIFPAQLSFQATKISVNCCPRRLHFLLLAPSSSFFTFFFFWNLPLNSSFDSTTAAPAPFSAQDSSDETF